MKTRFSTHFLSEMMMSEVDPYRSDHFPVGEQCPPCGGIHPTDTSRALFIDIIDAAGERIKRDQQSITIDMKPAAIPGMLYALYYDSDKWEDWGLEGAPLIRVAKRLALEAQIAHPDVVAQSVYSVNWDGSLSRSYAR